MTFDERLQVVNAQYEQTGRYRVATQAGPGTSSATILYDTADGNNRLVVLDMFDKRSEAIAERDRLNGAVQ